MSQQHKKWVALVEQRLKEKNWSKRDLAQAVGLRSQGTITDLLKTGKGSVDLKLRVSKILGIREPWEEFEEKIIQTVRKGVTMNEIELTEDENVIFQCYMIRNDASMRDGLFNWIMNEPLKRRMITSGTTHERIFHLMYPSLKQQVVVGTGKGGYKKWGVKKFTLDFYDENKNIAYEIDGKSHETEIGKLQDKYRDMLLRYLYDIRTVRYSNEEVENMLKRRIKELGVEYFGINNK